MSLQTGLISGDSPRTGRVSLSSISGANASPVPGNSAAPVATTPFRRLENSLQLPSSSVSGRPLPRPRAGPASRETDRLRRIDDVLQGGSKRDAATLLFELYADTNGDGTLDMGEYSRFLRGIGAWGHGSYTDNGWADRWPEECKALGCGVEGVVTPKAFADVLYGPGLRANLALKDLKNAKLHMTMTADHETQPVEDQLPARPPRSPQPADGGLGLLLSQVAELRDAPPAAREQLFCSLPPETATVMRVATKLEATEIQNLMGAIEAMQRGEPPLPVAVGTAFKVFTALPPEGKRVVTSALPERASKIIQTFVAAPGIDGIITPFLNLYAREESIELFFLYQSNL